MAVETGDDFNIENFFIKPEDSEVKEETEDISLEDPFGSLEKKPSTEDPDPNNIFGLEDKDSGSVGKEDKDKSGQEGDTTHKETEGTSPYYSSILAALKGDGILPDIDDDFVKNAKSPEDFASAIEKQVEARMDEATKRVKTALDNGVEPDEISYYENAIKYFDSIKEEDITGEDEGSEALRRKIISQDLLNRGLSKERVEKNLKRIFDSGEDIEEAKLALKSNKDFFTNEYKEVLKEAEEAANANRVKAKQAFEAFSRKVLDTEEPFKGIKVDKKTRQLILDNATKPVYKDERGNMLTAYQKYQKENPIEAQYYINALFTLTNGFKNLEGIVKPTVRDKENQHIRDLEKNLKSAVGFQDSGNSLFGNKPDPQSRFNLELDI